MQTSRLGHRSTGAAAPRRLEVLLGRREEPTGLTDLTDQTEWLGWVPSEPRPGTAVLAEEPPAGRHRAERSTRGRRLSVAAVLPSTVREARWAVSWRAVLGASLVLLLLGAGVAALAAVEAPGSPVPERVVATAAAGPAPAAAGDGAGALDVAEGPGAGGTTVEPPAVGEAAQLVVHVVGQVELPGVVRVPSGSRVGDALEAAGGATATADLARVNLARALVDGEQLVVPRPGEVLVQAPGPVLPPGPGAGGASGPTGAAGAAGGGPATEAQALDLNTADLADLDALPGIGPVLAQRILEWRTDHGRFTDVDELGEVTGIGEKVLDKLRAQVRV